VRSTTNVTPANLYQILDYSLLSNPYVRTVEPVERDKIKLQLVASMQNPKYLVAS